jgi:5-methylcytosine-specific restriction endonuclease McrA
MANATHNSRPNRESLSKRLGKMAGQIKARDGFACVYCGGTQESTGAHLHLDHVVPKSHGGVDHASNLVLACRSCNSRRKDMLLADWCALIGVPAVRIIRQINKELT